MSHSNSLFYLEKKPQRPNNNLCTKLSNTCLSAYLGSPINLSFFTGMLYPHIPRLRGNPIWGRVSSLAKNLDNEIKAMGKLATAHASGMCYEWLGPSSIAVLVLKPQDIQCIIQEDDKAFSRNKNLRGGFTHVYPHTVFGMSASTIEEKKTWKSHRDPLKHALLDTQSLKKTFPELKDVLIKNIEKLESKESKTSTHELASFFSLLAMDAIVQTQMNLSDIEKTAPQLFSIFTQAMKVMTSVTAITLGRLQESIALPVKTPTDKIRSALFSTIEKYVITPNKDVLLKNETLFTQILKAHFPDQEIDEHILKTPESLANAAFLILAGHETTSRLMQFALMELARQPKIVAKLREEFKNAGAIQEFDDIDKLPYLNKIICESLRLDPPVPIIAREVTQKITLGNNVTLHKGATLFVSPYLTHRLPEVAGENPDSFNPERWNEKENPLLFKNYGYFPFWSAKRECVGKRFALIEAKIALFIIFSCFNVKLLRKENQTEETLFAKTSHGTLQTIYPIQAEFTRCDRGR